MNKSEKIICILLGLVLAWYVYNESSKSKARAAEAAKAQLVAATNIAAKAISEEPKKVEAPAVAKRQALPAPSIPENMVALENDEVRIELSSWGAVVKKATLKGYAKECGAVSDENPAVALEFSESPLGELTGVPGLEPNAAYRVVASSSNEVVFANDLVTRRITLEDGYRLVYREQFAASARNASGVGTTLSLGSVAMGASKNDLLSVDSWARDAGKGKEGVLHHCEGDSPLKPYLVGGLTGGCSGCSGAPSGASCPPETSVRVGGAQRWIALKNRFFVVALASSTQENDGFDATVAKDAKSASYRPESVTAAARFAGVPEMRESVFFVGPKKQSLLWDLGMKDVMEFGMWRWLCYPLVWVLNLFNSWIPNYGVAIILLTILVRLLFWPLTHKSTVGMKKMQEIQPKMKAIQAKFKDNPQRLQQETWALYKSEKVNPMSSCLPMLIQIPVFIALFNVLRSAVELRYAPFLWIADLSEPEGLFAAYLPFGGLNLLPILMAVTTGLQSAFTPSTGDKSQQRMMMVFMPVMMLVMFYSFPSALSLYWFLSNLFSIVQMWMIRRATAKEQKSNVLVPDEIIDPPQTRQMRRHA